VPQRLSRDDFHKTIELVGSLGTREWKVCKEYRLEDPPDAPERDSSPYALEGRYPFDSYSLVGRYPHDSSYRHKWRTYAPLEDTPDLFLRFARLSEREDPHDAMLEWVHQYGVLGHPDLRAQRYEAPQYASSFVQEVKRAAGILALYEAALNGDAEEAKSTMDKVSPDVGIGWHTYKVQFDHSMHIDREAFAAGSSDMVDAARNENWVEVALNMAAWDVQYMVGNDCSPALRVEKGCRNPSGVTAHWNFMSLLGAMYLQMYWLMAAGGNVARCRYCRRMISLASPAPDARKTRQDKKFCDDACRQRHHYHAKTKPRRQGKHS
jgi:hypothetical protein